MKTIFLSIATASIFLVACNDNNSAKNSSDKKPEDAKIETQQIPATDTKAQASITEITSGYLQLKNALANDNGNEASAAGKSIVATLSKVEKSAFTADQQKVYDEIESDLKENAEHIGDNAGKIDHQREHFEMLSKDIYDLVKVFKPAQTLYKDFCPMYDGGKGANWISETKEIKNPYMGKKMATCGSVKEEIKP